MSIAIHLAAERIGHLGQLPLTSSLIGTWIAMAVLVILALAIRLRLRPVPGPFQAAVETVFDGAEKLTTDLLGSGRVFRLAFPILLTFFLLIVTSNWAGILPGVGSLGILALQDSEVQLIPLIRSGNADLNSTLAWAIISVFVAQLLGILSAGARYGNRFFSLKNPVVTFVGLLELISEVAKIISFSFRLFGNIFAGEVLLIVVSALVPLLAPLPFLGLELLVGLVQALVFVMLSLVFFKIAVEVACGH